MAETFHLSLLTPEKSFLEAEVTSIVAPGSEGYLGVLANHAPLITALAPGKLTIKFAEGGGTGGSGGAAGGAASAAGPAGEAVYAISGGFLEVSDNKATILADALEPPESIDVARARRARERAEERLKDLSGKVDGARAEAALARAINRIRIASTTGSGS
jgi:F-type H+-transporting ATPase subunit epsilon